MILNLRDCLLSAWIWCSKRKLNHAFSIFHTRKTPYLNFEYISARRIVWFTIKKNEIKKNPKDLLLKCKKLNWISKHLFSKSKCLILRFNSIVYITYNKIYHEEREKKNKNYIKSTSKPSHRSHLNSTWGITISISHQIENE